MHQDITSVKRALISVSDKTGIVELARGLHALNIEIISTGGTSKLLREKNIPVRDVEDITHFPEMMNGRVKTLHPHIHGGILGLRDEHASIAQSQQIGWIDLVVVNLYPFSDIIKKADVTLDEAVENIDIGGPALIRSAAKNMGWVGVLVDAADYTAVLTELRENAGLNFATRKKLATKAFLHTAEYDEIIHNYLTRTSRAFPTSINLFLEKAYDLRYGENPHQASSAYKIPDAAAGILFAKQHQGKQLSYNNIADADAAYACVRGFSHTACVIVKHANPCGVAIAENVADAFSRAYAADSLSAFGGIVALNHPCTKEAAEAISQVFIEVVIAPGYTQDALDILANKPNLRVLELELVPQKATLHDMKFIEGGVLVQDKDIGVISMAHLSVVTKLQPSAKEIETLLFAWEVLKHVKSNAILIAKAGVTVGIGAGQVSRVDAVDLAIKKAGTNIAGSVLASDAFFPFRDSIDHLGNTRISAIIQPGGSVRDEEVIAACNEYGIAMVFTGIRCFKH